MKATHVRWLSDLASWVRSVLPKSRPLDWADYAATKDWETAEMLWREEQTRKRAN